MRRRDFIEGPSSAVAWPIAAPPSPALSPEGAPLRPETLMEKRRMKRMFVLRTIGLMSALSLAMYSGVVPRAHAFDSSKWGHDAATSEWFRSLKNSRGESCCDYDDGVRLEDPEWRELKDHSFEVFSRGKWNKIPPNRVLKGTNRVGYAILWWPKAWDNPTCFLPGPEN
jgi:hypothetical protein